MCITQVKLTTLMKKKKILYLHLIPHFQRIQMYHIIPKNIVSNLFQFEVVHEENIFWDHAWLQIYDKSYYWFWQVPKHSMQLFPPLLYSTPCLFGEDAKTWMGSRVSMQECMQPQHCLWKVVEDGNHHQQLVWWKVVRSFENQEWKNLEPCDGNQASKIATKGMQLWMWLFTKLVVEYIKRPTRQE